jgi:hypothetical protein
VQPEGDPRAPRPSRAQGGSDEPWNLVGLCAVHHLRAIHGGYMRVTGRAPDGLRWEVAGRPFFAGGAPGEAGGHGQAWES